MMAHVKMITDKIGSQSSNLVMALFGPPRSYVVASIWPVELRIPFAGTFAASASFLDSDEWLRANMKTILHRSYPSPSQATFTPQFDSKCATQSTHYLATDDLGSHPHLSAPT